MKGDVLGVFRQSTIVFLEANEALNRYLSDASPVVTIFSFRDMVKRTMTEQDEWIKSEVYYQRRDHSRVLLSHGACPRCSESLTGLLKA